MTKPKEEAIFEKRKSEWDRRTMKMKIWFRKKNSHIEYEEEDKYFMYITIRLDNNNGGVYV